MGYKERKIQLKKTFKPREEWEPSPIISIVFSEVHSPTMATTLEVPISRPTMRFFSVFFDIFLFLSLIDRTTTVSPLHGKTIGIAQIHPSDRRRLHRQNMRVGTYKAL